LIERTNSEPVIIGIVLDITKEKEFERELQAQKEVQEMEMKNMFDVLQIDPVIFQDFIEDSESNFYLINSFLQDRSLTEKQVVTKTYQVIHAIKANALILGLENLGKKMHLLEDEVKTLSDKNTITMDDILSLSFKIEVLRQEMDSYTAVTSKINAHKDTTHLDTVFLNSLSKAVQRLSGEVQKKVDIKAEHIDIDILESSLRKPIKEILYQCVRNSIYHGIETAEARVKKHKKAQGLLTFSIKNVGNKAEIIYSDEGSGFDWQKITKKYLEEHPETQTTVDRKILLKSIFEPGFSTSEETSSMAGRGVGLSLVMDLVKENHGSLNVNSSETGLTFKFVFPLAA
jgi:two-component system chemotaxis sensor kinase CheA